MLLSARILTQVSSANDFTYAQSVQFTQGDTVNVYLQLVDITKDKQCGGRRYMPSGVTSLAVSLNPINDNKKILRYASQPFTEDPSIWMFPILPTDCIMGTMDIQLALLQGTITTNGVLRAGINAQPLNGAYADISRNKFPY